MRSYRPPRPVEVLHDGRWLPAQLEAARRDEQGLWRGLVRYHVDVGDQRYHWRPESDLKAAEPVHAPS